MDERQSALRLYTVVGALIGLTIGLFTHGQLAFASGGLVAVWLGVFGVLGLAVGRMLYLVQLDDERDALADGDEAAEQEPATPFFALQSGVYSSSQLKTMRVRAQKSPLAPPELELRLLVEDHDTALRVALLEGAYPKLSAHELMERAASIAQGKAPKGSSADALSLVSYGSEGPVDTQGQCAEGWSFHFVDGTLGLGCLVTVTSEGFTLHYRTAATYFRPALPCPWRCPAEAIATVREQAPELDGLDLWIKVLLPSDVLVYTLDPFLVVDVDADARVVRNASRVAKRLRTEQDTLERYALDDVYAFWRGEETGELAALVQEEPRFGDALRRLDGDALLRAAEAVYRRDGPDAIARLRDEIWASDATERSRERLGLLARMPSGLVASVLQHACVSLADVDARAYAESLLRERRAGALGTTDDALDPLEFVGSRAAMGKTLVRTLPIVSTYDPERVVLPALTELGFSLVRTRELSGDANLLLAAQLRSDDLEAMLLSTPLPVPCHLLHLVGAGAPEMAERIRQSDIHYERADILRDARSTSPTRVHRAALYVSAMQLAAPDLPGHFSAVLDRGGLDVHVQRAILLALSVQARGFAEAVLRRYASDDESPLQTYAAELLERRASSPPVEISATGRLVAVP